MAEDQTGRERISRTGELTTAASGYQDFSGAYFGEGTVENITFTGDDFSGCTFKKVKFSNCTFSITKFPKSTFSGCTFENVKFVGGNFAEASQDQLTSKNQGAVFEKVTLKEVTFEGTIFSTGFMSSTQFKGCTLDQLTFENIDLGFTIFPDCRIDNTNFRNTKLKILTETFDSATFLDKGQGFSDNQWVQVQKAKRERETADKKLGETISVDLTAPWTPAERILTGMGFGALGGAALTIAFVLMAFLDNGPLKGLLPDWASIVIAVATPFISTIVGTFVGFLYDKYDKWKSPPPEANVIEDTGRPESEATLTDENQQQTNSAQYGKVVGEVAKVENGPSTETTPEKTATTEKKL